MECGSAAAALTGKPKQAKTLPKKSEGKPSHSKAQAPLAHSKETGRVWINPTQYFDGVPEEVWQFHIGGYQVCHKWLKDRKGRRLSYDDIAHYQRIVAALSETIRLMAEIDGAIAAHGGWPIR